MTPIYANRPGPWAVPKSIKNDLTGLTVVRLTVLGFSFTHKTPGGSSQPRWLCRCSCGNYCPVGSANLRNGASRSCGCLKAEEARDRFTTHGLSNSEEYKAWKRMKNRCYNKNTERYPRYGGRGIYVYEKWKNNFPALLKYMGPMPEGMNSIERLDNDKPYIPGNVTWGNDLMQQNNTSRTRRMSDGKSLADNARRIGLPYKALMSRLQKGWCEACALSLPYKPGIRGCPHRESKRIYKLKFNNGQTLVDFCKENFLDYKSSARRFREGWCMDCIKSLPISPGNKGCSHR